MRIKKRENASPQPFTVKQFGRKKKYDGIRRKIDVSKVEKKDSYRDGSKKKEYLVAFHRENKLK